MQGLGRLAHHACSMQNRVSGPDGRGRARKGGGVSLPVHRGRAREGGGVSLPNHTGRARKGGGAGLRSWGSGPKRALKPYLLAVYEPCNRQS